MEAMKEKQRLDDLKDEEFLKQQEKDNQTISFKKSAKSIEPQLAFNSNEVKIQTNQTKQSNQTQHANQT